MNQHFRHFSGKSSFGKVLTEEAELTKRALPLNTSRRLFVTMCVPGPVAENQSIHNNRSSGNIGICHTLNTKALPTSANVIPLILWDAEGPIMMDYLPKEHIIGRTHYVFPLSQIIGEIKEQWQSLFYELGF